jgi:hypothetical protein
MNHVLQNENPKSVNILKVYKRAHKKCFLIKKHSSLKQKEEYPNKLALIKIRIAITTSTDTRTHGRISSFLSLHIKERTF